MGRVFPEGRWAISVARWNKMQCGPTQIPPRPLPPSPRLPRGESCLHDSVCNYSIVSCAWPKSASIHGIRSVSVAVQTGTENDILIRRLAVRGALSRPTLTPTNPFLRLRVHVTLTSQSIAFLRLALEFVSPCAVTDSVPWLVSFLVIPPVLTCSSRNKMTLMNWRQIAADSYWWRRRQSVSRPPNPRNRVSRVPIFVCRLPTLILIMDATIKKICSPPPPNFKYEWSLDSKDCGDICYPCGRDIDLYPALEPSILLLPSFIIVRIPVND